MTEAKILIAEDEPEMNGMISDYLKKYNFRVTSIFNGNEFRSTFEFFKPDIILLDLMMPGRDGYSILEDLRDNYNHSGVIIISAKSMLNDRLLGFSLGADDFLVKPFSLKELLARVKALLNRLHKNENTNTDIISDGLCEIDKSRAVVTINKSEIFLTSIQLKIFDFIFKRPGRIFSREYIAGEFEISEPRTVDAHIKNIRKKFQPAGGDKHIVTVRNMGYKYEKNV